MLNTLGTGEILLLCFIGALIGGISGWIYKKRSKSNVAINTSMGFGVIGLFIGVAIPAILFVTLKPRNLSYSQAETMASALIFCIILGGGIGAAWLPILYAKFKKKKEIEQ